MRDSFQAGCQTNAWAVNPDAPETFFAALRAIKELGFSGFETSFRNLRAFSRDVGGSLDALGLQFFGVHIFLAEYDPSTSVPPRDLVIEVMSLASKLGAQRLILSGAPVENTVRLRAKAESLKRLAELAAKVGMGLCYHNHAPELEAQPEHPSELESLVGETSDSAVQFVLDAGHAFRAGLPVAQLAARLASRTAAIHLRDFSNGAQVPLGSGEFPLADVSAALRAVRWHGWVIAEEERADNSKPGLPAVAQARKALRLAFDA